MKTFKGKSLSPVQPFATPWTVAYQAFCPWDFPGKSTGVGCHFLPQGVFLTQGLFPGLPHCKQMLSCLSHQGRWRHILFLLYCLQFSCSVMSDSFLLLGLQHTRPPCPSPTPRVYSYSCPLSW